MSGCVFWPNTDEIINVEVTEVVSTLAVSITGTSITRVGLTRGRRNSSSEDPADGIAGSLGTKAGSFVSKRKGSVNKDLTLPLDSQEGGLPRTDKEEPVVSGHVNLE